MDEIRRWNAFIDDYLRPYMATRIDGKYVLYTEYLSALQSARAEIEIYNKTIYGKLKAEAARMREAILECERKQLAEIRSIGEWEKKLKNDTSGQKEYYSGNTTGLVNSLVRIRAILTPPAAPEKAEACRWIEFYVENSPAAEHYKTDCGHEETIKRYFGKVPDNCPHCGKPIAEGGE